MTHYQILGVTPDTDVAGIRKAWLEKAKALHPDVNKSPDAEAKFKAAKDAYEVLSDPERRAAYDLSLYAPRSQAQPGHSHSSQFNEAIRNAMNSPAFGGQQPATDGPDVFDGGPTLSEVFGGLVDSVAASYVGRNPLLRAAYKRVRPEIHSSLRNVLHEDPPVPKKRRSA